MYLVTALCQYLVNTTYNPFPTISYTELGTQYKQCLHNFGVICKKEPGSERIRTRVLKTRNHLSSSTALGLLAHLQDHPDHSSEAEVRDLGLDPLQAELDVAVAGVDDVLTGIQIIFPSLMAPKPSLDF